MPQPKFVVPVLGSKMFISIIMETKKEEDKCGHLVCLALFLPALAVYVMASVDEDKLGHDISFV